VGDLVAEFGRVPEGVEDMALAALGDALQGGFSGKPAKQMGTLIARLVSSKMPAGFHQKAMQDHLQYRWGFTKSHSIIPICLATTIEPATRLPNAEAARLYLDELVNRYIAFQGIALIPTIDSDDSQNAASPHAVNSAKLESFDEEQRIYYRKQFDILAKYLQIDIGASEEPTTDAVDQEKLDRWNAEFDDQFLYGTKPIFDPGRVRHYDSWWNWAREELIQWSHQFSPNPADAILPSHRRRRILNRWEPSCSAIIESVLEPSCSPQCPGQILSPASNIRLVLKELLRLGKLALARDPVYIYSDPPLGPKTILTDSGQPEYIEVPRAVSFYPDVVRQGRICPVDHETIIPFVHIKCRTGETDWKYNVKATSTLHEALDVGSTAGFTFAGKVVLITGAGPDSIGAEVLRGLLSGGAIVVVTTSREVSDSAAFYQNIYHEYGSKGSSLTVLPMNQGSKQDCEALIEYLYSARSPTGGDLDYVMPFAAIPQVGEVDTLGTRQELALRTMLVNVLRLVGCIRQQKEKRRIHCRPTMALLPMSCNEGTFGGDGLYAESKIGLKTLFNRFHSESWSKYVTVCGVVIGWTRGTGLMRSSNTLAEEVERRGVVTFTQSEMAFNILALMTPEITTFAEEAPVYADLTGGLGSMWNIKDGISASRKRLAEETQMQKALAEENARHQAVLLGQHQQTQQRKEINEINISRRRARLTLQFPSLQTYGDITAQLPKLRGMIDISHTVVVVGFSELGPWGNSRTRWEMEHQGRFTLEGYIEMAWIMGLIKHVDGELKGRPHVGWVDAETQEPIHDHDVPQRYHDRIMSGTGIRLIEPDGLDEYVPSQKEFLQEVAVEDDLPPFECSRATAEAFKLRHGEKISLQRVPASDNYLVSLKKGAVLMIAKTIPFHQSVAGAVPTGWNPLHYGIPEDIIQQVDATTLYALCCVSEAFLSAGIKDPYEIYRHIHVSELANCLGTGGGPLKIIQNMYRDRFLDRPTRGDIILEHFLNTMGAWVNMLLLSAAGPLKTPVGACATALESLDIGCDAIHSGKCKVAIVGGCDDYREELSYEFANIKATANCAEELDRGRLPSEMSRPTASSRSGFAESAGCGVQILMNAELALKLGLPIHGILAYSQMASDRIGRSIPAPGKGILTAARETMEAKYSSFLDLAFRRAGFDAEVTDIQQKFDNGPLLKMQVSADTQGEVDQSILMRIRDAQCRWAHNIRLQDPAISPLRAALATWGLAVDDIGVASMHGTSTKANDVNEGEVINAQMEHLGRRKGNPLLSVCQKSLTGHPKAAAGAWQLNGCMQILREGLVPGNRNADNIDKQLRQFEHLVYPTKSIQTTGIKAAMVTSFGFGQKGAIAVMVAPKYLFASLSAPTYEEYRMRVTEKQRRATTAFVSRMLKNSIVQVKGRPPWSDSDAMESVFLDPNSRRQGIQPQPSFVSKPCTDFSPLAPTVDDHASHTVTDISEEATVSIHVEKMLAEAAERSKTMPSRTIGVDVEEITSINLENDTFLLRNFTPAEREYCLKAPDPQASFAGRWSAKEAVFKSLQTSSRGSGTAMDGIEVLNEGGVPKVFVSVFVDCL
jgi:fatty acid synthase subunit alpha